VASYRYRIQTWVPNVTVPRLDMSLEGRQVCREIVTLMIHNLQYPLVIPRAMRGIGHVSPSASAGVSFIPQPLPFSTARGTVRCHTLPPCQPARYGWEMMTSDITARISSRPAHVRSHRHTHKPHRGLLLFAIRNCLVLSQPNGL
jgi:hypothetical protein